MSATENSRLLQSQEAPSNTIEVVLKHSGTETRIIGNPETVTREILTYLSKIFPSIQIVSQVFLTSDTGEFLQGCAGIIAQR
jgi:hypothetical protein